MNQDSVSRVALWAIAGLLACLIGMESASLWLTTRDHSLEREKRLVEIAASSSRVIDATKTLVEGRQDALVQMIKQTESNAVKFESLLQKAVSLAKEAGKSEGYVEAANLLAANVDLIPTDRDAWRGQSQDGLLRVDSVRYIPEDDRNGRLVGVVRNLSRVSYSKITFTVFVAGVGGTPVPCTAEVQALVSGRSMPFVAPCMFATVPDAILSVKIVPDRTVARRR